MSAARRRATKPDPLRVALRSTRAKIRRVCKLLEVDGLMRHHLTLNRLSGIEKRLLVQLAERSK